MFPDVLFQKLEVPVGQGVFRHGSRVVLHGNDFQMIVPSFGTAHATVSHEGIDFAGNVLCANEDSRVVVEEGHKMVDARPLGLLVTDEADGVVDSLLTQLEDATEGFFHLDVDTAILPAQFYEKLVRQVIT